MVNLLSLISLCRGIGFITAHAFVAEGSQRRLNHPPSCGVAVEVLTYNALMAIIELKSLIS